MCFTKVGPCTLLARARQKVFLNDALRSVTRRPSNGNILSMYICRLFEQCFLSDALEGFSPIIGQVQWITSSCKKGVGFKNCFLYLLCKVPITAGLGLAPPPSPVSLSASRATANRRRRNSWMVRRQIPSSQLSPLYPGLQMQVPMMQVPWLLQETSMHWLVGTSHSAPFHPLWHKHRPFMYCPFPLHSTGQDAKKQRRGEKHTHLKTFLFVGLEFCKNSLC